MAPTVRRVVTGNNAAGKSVVIYDGQLPDGPSPHDRYIWTTSAFDNRDAADAAEAPLRLEPPIGGSAFRVVEFPPASALAGLTSEQKEAFFRDLFAGMEAAHCRVDTSRSPGMHTTATIDYAVVLRGEVTLLLDEGEATLKQGDVVVQRATNHDWVVRGDEPAMIGVVMMTSPSVTALPRTMKAARMHKVGEPMILEDFYTPKPRSHDVLVRVHSCGIVPNLGNILKNWTTWYPERPLPPLPAIFGLDPAGEIAAVGEQVHDWKVGDRVYVNPARYCCGCRACRAGDHINCGYWTFNGYFGFSEKSMAIFRDYPYAGLGEYMTAPQYSLVKLPDNVTFDQAARFGYLGTAYAGMRKAGVGVGKTMLVNGISGTLGIGGALLGLAMGATKILGTARNKDLLQRVKALNPSRIEVLSLDDKVPIDTWVNQVTGGEGVDIFIDCLGPGSPHETMLAGVRSLKRGGKAVNIGAIAGNVPMDLHTMMDLNQSMTGSCWFTAAEGQDMADMAGAGVLNLSVFEQVTFPLQQVNEAISGIENRNGGFSNYVIKP